MRVAARPCTAPCSDDESDLGHLWESFGLTPVAVAGDRQDGATAAASSTAPLQALPLYSPAFSEPATQGGYPGVWGLWGYPVQAAQSVQRQWGTIWGCANPATAATAASAVLSASASPATAQGGGFVTANVYDPPPADADSELAMTGTLASSVAVEAGGDEDSSTDGPSRAGCELETGASPQCPHPQAKDSPGDVSSPGEYLLYLSLRLPPSLLPHHPLTCV